MRVSLTKFIAWSTVFTVIAATNATIVDIRRCLADEPERDGPWLVERAAEKLTYTAQMSVPVAAEPSPALSIRLTPDASDQVEGNSAIYYLKAMGFFEQEVAAQLIREFKDKSRKRAAEQGLDDQSVPPYSWLETPPSQLPIAEVKTFLQYHNFQPPLLAEACKRTSFSLDRNIRQVESPIAYLLPEIQSMRELSRVQSLRCRLAVAEHRVSDAIEILKQQFTLARHLGTDEFLISNLVGAAILGIACQDLIYVQQEPGAPNLYWALASLPTPMIDMRQALSIERQIWAIQLKALRDVDDTPRPAGYWQDFIDRISPQVREIGLIESSWFQGDPQVARTAFVSAVAASYPGAKRYLIEDCKMDRAKVDAYPTAQVVFLAMKRFNERSVDDCFKWLYLPYDQAAGRAEFKRMDDVRTASSVRAGWLSAPGDLLLSGIQNIRTAQARVQQQLGFFQTIEAIRMHGAANNGKLPASLNELPYPAPIDVLNGKPFRYEVMGDQATLSGDSLPYNNLQYRFQLRIAKP